MPSLNLSSFLMSSSVTVTVFFVSIVLSRKVNLISATTTPMNNQSQMIGNTTTSNIQIRSPQPPLIPAKSLFNSPLFQTDNILGGVMKTFTNALPLRESYIAYEQAHPSSLDTSSSQQDFDPYFKPSKFPGLSYERPTSSTYFTKLQNPFSGFNPQPQQLPPQYYQPQQSNYYMPPPFSQPPQFSAPPPPPPPPPPSHILRLVKIPGDLQITVKAGGNGRKDLEVVCEFPPYILIVQQIYWHVIPPPSTLLLPYGTFYDSRNGFAPRVTVTNLSKWRSVLIVRDYTPDDFGTYRCVSTAILPDEPEPAYSVQLPPQLPPPPPTNGYYTSFQHPDTYELRSAASSLSSRRPESKKSAELKEKDDMKTSESETRQRKIKFLRKKREIGSFGVYAPFFRPQYGIYRVFKEIRFFGDLFGAGSEVVETTLNNPTSTDSGLNNGGGGLGTTSKVSSREDNQQKKTGARRFDSFTRRSSKVLF